MIRVTCKFFLKDYGILENSHEIPDEDFGSMQQKVNVLTTNFNKLKRTGANGTIGFYGAYFDVRAVEGFNVSYTEISI